MRKGLNLYGGLGDALIKIHDTTIYQELEHLAPDERAAVFIISHNPFVRELFTWHPKASQIDIYTSNYFFMDYGDPGARKNAGLPEIPIDEGGPREKLPLKFYPSPEDLEILSKLPERFLAIAPSASGMEIENRNIPGRLLNIAVGLATSRKIPVVFLGRTFQGPHHFKAPPKRPEGPGIIDLTDKLSVPGSVEAVRRCTALFSAHSCLLQMAWYYRRPNFGVYPTKYKHHDFDNPNSPFGWGKNLPETSHCLFDVFTAKAFSRFIKKSFNPYRLLIVIPTLNRADLLIRNKEFLESVMPPHEVLILDNGNQKIDINVPIERPAQNLGISGSWNFFMRRAFEERDFDGLVILQDDIIWSMSQVYKAAQLLENHPDVDLFLAFHQFSVQVHRRSNLQTIGLYDERYGAYCEDDDYAMTMTQKKRIYHRFHELDPLEGSQIEGTFKGGIKQGNSSWVKLVEKWGPAVVRVNDHHIPQYITNRKAINST